MREWLAKLPKVDKVMQEPKVAEWSDRLDSSYIKEAVQDQVDQLRQGILAEKITDPQALELERVVEAVCQRLESIYQSSLRPVINGTGTVLHTNLGRALLSQEVMDSITQLGPNYSNLEYDLEAGSRGSRYVHLQEIMKRLTGAEDALVVNNNAAAVLLMLSALTESKEVLISRGELVEIGGSFRIPEVITRGGAILHEVGATNKTHLKDYQTGINENTGAILRVHTSNYHIVGFTDKPSDEELVSLAHEKGLMALNDLGSGLLIDLGRFGLPYEPTVKEAIDAGYDVVTFSGDKLLGGPQAGIVVGKKALLDKMRAHPLTRALRTDKVTLTALEVTMRQYLQPEQALAKIPVLQMIGQSQEVLFEKASSLKTKIQELSTEWELSIIEGESQVGGGSYPGATLPTKLLELFHPKVGAAQIEAHLRANYIPIIARVHQDRIQFDVRTVKEQDFEIIVQALASI